VAAQPANEPPAPEAELADAPPPDQRFLIAASLAGAAVFAVMAWIVDALAHVGLYGKLDDVLWVAPYWTDATAILGHQVPYLDFPVEYPPLAIPVFVLPALPPEAAGYPAYRAWFEVLVTAIGLTIVPVVAWTVAWLGGRRLDVALAVGAVAVSPLLAGPIVISRYDVWPALLTAIAVGAMVRGGNRVGFAVLGLGILTKVYPAFLLPLFVIHAWRTAGRREAIIGAALATAVVAIGLAPFAVAALDGTLAPFTRSVARPLQVETLGASILATLHAFAGLPLARPIFDFGSFNLEGELPGVVAGVQTVVLLGVLGAIWLAATRLPATATTLVAACASAIAVNLALGKVLSPQYVIWLVPAIAVLVPSRGPRIVAALAAVLLLTTIYYPGWYGHYVDRFDATATLVVLERNIGLVLLAAYLIAGEGVVGALRRAWNGRKPGHRPEAPASG
jgi:uncharacterized membrane protein